MSILKALTIAIMAGSVTLWLWWDTFLASHGEQTESQFIAAMAHRCTMLPFMIGFIMGHWFANRPNLGASAWGRGIPLFLALGIFDLVWYYTTKSEMTWFRYPALWLVLGIPVGSLLWGQPL